MAMAGMIPDIAFSMPQQSAHFFSNINSRRRASWWKRLKRRAKERDNYTCRICKAPGEALWERGIILTVAHIRPIRTHPELARDLNNVITICALDDARYGERLEELKYLWSRAIEFS